MHRTLCKTILLVELTVPREEEVSWRLPRSGNVSNSPTWRRSAGRLAAKLTNASLKWDVGTSLGLQLLACSAPWDTQELNVGKPSKNWRGRQRRTASGCEENTGLREPSNKISSTPKCKTWTKLPASINIYWTKFRFLIYLEPHLAALPSR